MGNSVVLGRHLISELEECNPQLLDDLGYVRTTLVSAAQQMSAKIIGKIFHKFSPYGITGVVSIAESHLAIHTWPEYNYAALDIFTCGTVQDPYKAYALVAERLESKRQRVVELHRGLVPKLHL